MRSKQRIVLSLAGIVIIGFIAFAIKYPLVSLLETKGHYTIIESNVAPYMPMALTNILHKNVSQDIDDGETTFVAVSHFYEIATWESKPAYVDVLYDLTDEINKMNPDLIFLLGDITYGKTDMEWTTLRAHFLDRLLAPVFSAPGNHEFMRIESESGSLVTLDKNYQKYLGHYHSFLVTPQANFVLVASMDRNTNIGQFLQQIHNSIRGDKPTFLLGHHNLCDNARGRELMPFFDNKIKYLLSGDANPDFNHHDWDGIECYAIGMGARGSRSPDQKRAIPLDYNRVHFTFGTISDEGGVTIEPHYIKLPNNHPWYMAKYRDL